MVLSLRHRFLSRALFSLDNWNAEHTISAAAGTILGRDTSEDGAVQELPIAIDTNGNMALPAELTVAGQASFTDATAPIIAAKIGPSSTQQHTLPAVASDTVALLSAPQTLSNKTLAAPTFTGGMTVSGGLTVSSGGASITGNSSVTGTFLSSSTLTVSAGGIVVSAGGANITGSITTASWAGGVIAGEYGGTGVANTGKTITLGGDLTTSGAFSTTLTVTAATAVTLPTTGTLATLAGSETLTNKTLTSPSINAGALSGTFSGNHTVSGQASFTEATAPIISAKIGPSSSQQHTLPTVTSDTIVLADAAQTLTNKTLTSPTLSGGTINNASIGATTRSSGAFTTLDANGNVTLGDASADTVTINGTVQPGVVISGSSAGDALRITQTGAGNALVVEDSTNPDSTPFVISPSGQAIVGHTASFNVGGLTPTLLLAGAGGSLSTIATARFTADTGAASLYLSKSRSTTVGTYGSVVSSGDGIGTIVWTADDGSATPIPAASITSAVDGTPGTNDMPGRLTFSTTADGASSVTERMRIASNGLATIGSQAHSGAALSTTAPAKLYTSTGTYTDTATAASGTVTHGTIVAFDNPAINSTNASVTYTNASTVYIDGAPTGTGNVTVSTGYALFVAAGASRFGGSVLSTSATGGVGYATGAGGAQTQGTSRTTGVTLNAVCGAITLVSAAGSTTWSTMTVTNSAVAATDTVVVCQKSGTDLYEIHVTAVAAGSFNITFRTTGGTTTEQPTFNFSVIKAVAA